MGSSPYLHQTWHLRQGIKAVRLAGTWMTRGSICTGCAPFSWEPAPPPHKSLKHALREVFHHCRATQYQPKPVFVISIFWLSRLKTARACCATNSAANSNFGVYGNPMVLSWLGSMLEPWGARILLLLPNDDPNTYQSGQMLRKCHQ